MLLRTVVSGLVPLFLVIILLATRVSPTAARTLLPLTPPPIAPHTERRGPLPSQPLTPTVTASGTVPVEVTSAVTLPLALSPTPQLTATEMSTPIVTPTLVVTLPAVTIITATATTATGITPAGITPTEAPSFLPTVTPTSQTLLLPTPTPRPLPTSSPTMAPSATITPAELVTATVAPVATTVPARGASGIALPTATNTPVATEMPTVMPTVMPTAIPSLTPTNSEVTPTVDLPSPFITVSVPLPLSYQAQGSFASQTIYTDTSIVQQQGNFTIMQTAAVNAYGANQHYTLRTQRAAGQNGGQNSGQSDEINVYQIDNYIAVSYTGGEWMLARRDQGSNIVRAIQPITDLALLFPRILDQADLIGQEEIGGIASLHYRMDDPAGQGAHLIQPLLALTGDIRSLKLEVWIAVPGGYVVAYNFQVELAGARVLDAGGNEVRADQAVTWTYQLAPDEAPQTIAWPSDAPTPSAFPVPGFAVGTFPLPPNTELLTLVSGVPDLITTETPVAVDSFYRSELTTLGWTVEGGEGLLRCSKEGTNIELLISEDSANGGTRISVLPGE